VAGVSKAGLFNPLFAGNMLPATQHYAAPGNTCNQKCFDPFPGKAEIEIKSYLKLESCLLTETYEFSFGKYAKNSTINKRKYAVQLNTLISYHTVLHVSVRMTLHQAIFYKTLNKNWVHLSTGPASWLGGQNS